MDKELENIASLFNKWCLRKNIMAAKNTNLPIIFVRDSAHCSYLEFELRRSKKRYDQEVIINGKYQGERNLLIIEYDRCAKIKNLKEEIKDFVIEYIRLKKEIATFKFTNINKACTDLIDNDCIFLNKESNIIIKSIISKTEVIDYGGKTYNIKDLYIRFLY